VPCEIRGQRPEWRLSRGLRAEERQDAGLLIRLYPAELDALRGLPLRGGATVGVYARGRPPEAPETGRPVVALAPPKPLQHSNTTECNAHEASSGVHQRVDVCSCDY